MEAFRNKVAFVTGAASGIGRALCVKLAAEGARVIAADINEKLLQETMGMLGKKGYSAKSAHLDVTDYEAFKKLIDETISEEGRLDYLFNNAGIAIAGEVRDLSIDHWRRVLDTNLNGVLYGSILAYKSMVEQGFGHIVNLSSIEGLIPFPTTVSYVVSKFAVMGLSQGLWVEGADLGVKVSVVCPGLVRTPIFDTSPMINFSRKEWLSANAAWQRFSISPEGCAHAILKGVAKNKPIITVPPLARIMWWLARIRPTLVLNFVRKDFRKWREKGRNAACEKNGLEGELA